MQQSIRFRIMAPCENHMFQVNYLYTQDTCEWMILFKLGFTPYNTEQPLQGMELQEKEA